MTYTDLADINLALFDGGAPPEGRARGRRPPQARLR